MKREKEREKDFGFWILMILKAPTQTKTNFK
jgi:hypothetical protein